MKYWEKALQKLQESDSTMKAIYGIVCSYSDNVFFERLKGSAIEKTTYGEFDKKTKQLAAALKKRGMEKGSFVGLEMENSAEWVISFWGILMAGFVPVLVNTRISDAQNDKILHETRAACVVTDKPKREIDIDVLTLLVDQPQDFEPDWENHFALSTSGTSGDPKIFVYNGEALSAQIQNSKYVRKKNPTIEAYYKGELKLLAFLPFYHIFGLVATLMWFSFFGKTFVFLNDMRPETIQYTCKRHNVTHVFAIPLVWNGVAAFVRRQAKSEGEATEKKLEKALNFSIALQKSLGAFGKWIVSNIIFKGTRKRIFGDSIKFCISGGGYVKEDALKVFNGLGYSLHNGYGMTEIGIASVELRLNAQKRLSGSVGMPFPSIEFDIREDGVLHVRGRSLFCAHIKDGKSIPRDQSEWFDTRDVFEMEQESKHYFIKGRKDDIIVTEGGENIVPDLIEKHFDLQFAKFFTVLGLKLKEKTEIALVFNPDPKASAAQIDEMLLSVYQTNSELPLQERLGAVLLTDHPLPIVLQTKVQRKKLRQMIENNEIPYVRVNLSKYSNTQTVVDENYTKILLDVKKSFSEVLGLEEEKIEDASNFISDLGGGSLEYFSLLENLSKKFNITFKLEENFLITPKEFAAYISGC